MLVSIIIPTYNREKIIAKALESALNQTYSEIEVIVVDDGSTDNTKSLIEKYIKVYGDKLKYFYKENSGVSAARNVGIKVSKGEYISFLDSDDCIFPEKIEFQLNSIISNNADFCYCGHINVNKNGDLISESRINYIENNILCNYIKNKTTPNTNSWLIKKSLFDNILFRVGCSWGEDMEVFSKLSAGGKACYVDKNLVIVKVGNEENRLSNFSWDKIEKDVFIWNEIWKWLEMNISDDKHKEILKTAIFKYRLPALIIYRLYLGRADKNEFLYYYNKYKQETNIMLFGNGLRSIKLFCYRLYIKFYYKYRYGGL